MAIAFLSNDMFEQTSWAEMAMSVAISERIPMVIVLLEKLNWELLKSKRSVKAALRVLFTSCNHRHGGSDE